jgi:hypothetical protein
MVEVEVGIAEAGMAEAVWRSLDGGLCRSETDWCAGGRRGWLLAAPAMVPGRSSMSRGSGSVGQSVGQRKLYVQGVPSDHGRGAGECECECWVSRRAGAGAGERSGGHVRCTLILLCTAARADARRCGAVRYGAAIWHASVRVCEGAVYCTLAVQCWCGIRRWQATPCLAGGSHPWIWGAPRSRVLHDLEFAIVLLVIGASHHHR